MSIKKNKKKIFLILTLAFVLSGILVVFVLYEQQRTNYSDLFAEDYQTILDNIGEPIVDPVIPTIEHVVYWLNIDKTDEILYIENVWMCGDFAAELTVNAKERNWRIYVAIMSYSVYEGTGYSVFSPEGNFGHAFNVIHCLDGDDPGTELDVWYIEPQSDTVWQLNYNHYSIYNYYSELDGTVWEEIYWVNYYDYIG